MRKVKQCRRDPPRNAMEFHEFVDAFLLRQFRSQGAQGCIANGSLRVSFIMAAGSLAVPLAQGDEIVPLKIPECPAAPADFSRNDVSAWIAETTR